ncbi:MAG: hypothetical protein ACTSSE_17080 [Candidatus Thorarchaeota archaeon]
MFNINPTIKNNRALYWAGIIQLFYGLIELIDTITICLISAGLLPNLYASFVSVDSQMGTMLETMPAIFIVLFAFFTSQRILSGYWILQNQVKGYWLALFVTGVTAIGVWFLLPVSILDLVLVCPFVILLFKGKYQDSPIIPE